MDLLIMLRTRFDNREGLGKASTGTRDMSVDKEITQVPTCS